jgi:hypothetical protein
MKRPNIAWMLIAVGIAAPAAIAASGSIRGLVKDAQGNPLIGAAIVLAKVEGSGPEKVIKRISTDSQGKFIASGIAPGRYRMKAEAAGFASIEFPVSVKPNKVVVFDSILLRRIGTLSEEASLKPDPKYAARAARGTIFHYDEKKDSSKEAADNVSADRVPEVHGFVYAFGQTKRGRAQEGSLFASNFAISQHVAGTANLAVSGQLGYGEGAPHRLQALTTASAGDHHQLAVALGYGRFIFLRHGELGRLGQFSISATDTWQVSGPVLLVYGLEYTRFAEGAAGSSVLPRLGVALDVAPRRRLFAGLVPGSSTDEQSRVDLESGEIVFSEPKPVAQSAQAQPLADRSSRLQFGSEQVLPDGSTVEMMAFFDTVNGHGVGLLAITAQPSNVPNLFVQEHNGHARGVRVVYHKRLGRGLEGTIGYAFGEGQQLDPRGIIEPSNLFATRLFHVVSARVDAHLVRTGTHVSTVLRLAPQRAIFAIDPFQGQINTYDPNINVLITQALPSFGFLPGQLAAVIDLRNLLDQQTSVADDRQELIASRFHRLVRVGVSLRF